MKSKNYLIHLKILVLITLLIVLAIHKASADEKPVKIAITPFTLNAPEDMQYLTSGIQDMLESRLSQDENVIVISDEKTARAMEGVAEPIDENEARDIGRRLSADFVLIGSLTVFGSSASLDSRLVDVSGEKETAAFFDQSQSIDELVPKINTLAADVNAKMIGSAAAVTMSAGSPSSAPAPADDVREHPEKMTEDISPVQDTTAEAGAVAAAAGGVLSKDFWKSRTFKLNLHGLDLGDVDNDGKVETVVITANTVIIYRNDRGRLFKIWEMKGKMNDYFVGVDVGDINANGYAEIFVSGLNPQKSNVVSFVLEYDGGNYRKIVQDSDWFYRIVKTPDNPPALLGQKIRSNKPYSGHVFTMQWVADSYDTLDPILSRNGFNLLGLTYGRVMGDQHHQVLAYNDFNKLYLVLADGQIEWQDDKALGGNTLNMSRPSKEKGGTYHVRYLPMRIALMDLDADGVMEVVAVKNHDIVGGHMDQFRQYTKAHVVAFTWNGLGLVEKWSTEPVSGFIRDYALGDFDNDGKQELVAAVVQKEGKIIATTPKSHIITYDILDQ